MSVYTPGSLGGGMNGKPMGKPVPASNAVSPAAQLQNNITAMMHGPLNGTVPISAYGLSVTPGGASANTGGVGYAMAQPAPKAPTQNPLSLPSVARQQPQQQDSSSFQMPSMPSYSSGKGIGMQPAAMPQASPGGGGGGAAMAGFEEAASGAGYLGANGNMLNGRLGMRQPPALMGLRQAGVRY